MAQDTNIPQFAGEVEKYLIGSDSRLMPEKVALLKVLYYKKQSTPSDPFFAKMPISKLLFESEVGHIEPYIELGPNSLIQSDGHGHLTIKDIANFPDDLKEISSYGTLIEAISHWEKSIRERNESRAEKLKKVIDFTESSLQVLMKKYGEIVHGLSAKQLESICASIQNKSFDRGLGFKLLSRVAPAKSDTISRLFFDSLMYSTYCLILGLRLSNNTIFKRYYRSDELKGREPKRGELLKERNDTLAQTIREITSLLTRSQGDDGMWVLRDYDESLKLKDTGTILYLLKEIYRLIPDAEIDLEKIRKARDFILKKMELASRQGKHVIELKENWLRQTDLYTTMQTIVGLYCSNIILGLDNSVFFKNLFVISFFSYLKNLYKDGGFALTEEREADLETTAFVISSLFGKHSFALTQEIFADISGFKIDLIDVIYYYHRNRKAIEDEINNGRHLNKPADSFLAIYCAGAWPCSPYIMKLFEMTCERASKEMTDFRNVKIFDKSSSLPAMSITLATKYHNAMPVIHVLHHAILVLEVIFRYFEYPDEYWEDMKKILSKYQR